MKKLTAMLCATALSALASASMAQPVVLKFHHLWPSTAVPPTQIIGPWCDKIAAESDNRLQCQILHAMSGGGTPPQLLDRMRDGVDDIVITLPGYTPGRFPRMEVFELPFMSNSGEATGIAAWTFSQEHAKQEFDGFKLLAVWGHDAAYVHTSKRQIKQLDDFRGLRMRGPTRQVNKMLQNFGSTPVSMATSAIADSLSKGTIDGYALPWEVIAGFKMHEVTQFHTETPHSRPSLFSAVFFIGMNQAKYDSLPDDLKAVIDRNSGLELSRQIGATWDAAREPARKLAEERGNTILVLSEEETDRWIKASESVRTDWVADMKKRDIDGEALIQVATDLLAQAK